jgi:hypothetical protein
MVASTVARPRQETFMCPTDTTPDPRDMLRGPETPEFVEPKPARQRGTSADTAPAAAAGERPPLPDHPRVMAADIEDEDADPVVDTGPGIDDGALNRG